MERDAIIARLREHEAALKARGVIHAALFGSRERGEAGPESDTDIMVEIDPEATVTIYDYVALPEYVASLIDWPVDVVDRDAVHARTRVPAVADAIYAFQRTGRAPDSATSPSISSWRKASRQGWTRRHSLPTGFGSTLRSAASTSSRRHREDSRTT